MILFITVASMSCHSKGGFQNQEAFAKIDTLFPIEIPGNFSAQQEIKLDSAAINDFLVRHSHFAYFQKELFRFYKQRNYSMAWFDSTGMIEQAAILYNQINKMKEDGLPPDIPFFEEYASLMEFPSNTTKVQIELMQTSQYLHFAKKLLSGISEEDSKAQQWYIPRKKTDCIEILQNILEGGALPVTTELFPQYHLLKVQLATYFQIEKDGGWDSVRFINRKLKYGDTVNIIKDIKKRLRITGEYPNTDSSHFFDFELEQGVKKFQQSHGLKPDGIVNRATTTEMNFSVRERIEQIILNMERCRWLPRPTSNSYLLVNIPQFTLYVFKGGDLVFSCKAVVGKETNRTAIFKGDLKYIVFSPYWNVPTPIMIKEILPAIRRNKQYLSENHMEWFGSGIRQRPGPWNALGGVKFVFPNGYNIYMHDTPSKLLFNETERTFSHGCIRISEPKKLAMFLLSDQEAWTEDAIENAMLREMEKFVPLKTPVPVYVVYFTAFVDSDGVMNFSKDVYSRDLQLKKMILN